MLFVAETNQFCIILANLICKGKDGQWDATAARHADICVEMNHFGGQIAFAICWNGREDFGMKRNFHEGILGLTNQIYIFKFFYLI